MTSIGLIETKSTPGVARRLKDLSQWKWPRGADEQLWSPHAPSDVHVAMASRPPVVNQKFHPRLNIDFGGSRGCMLDSLIKVVATLTALTGREEHVITALEFKFITGSTQFYGKRGGVEQAFPIDGPGGERISRVALECTTRPGIRALEVCSPHPRRLPGCRDLHTGFERF